MSFLNFCTQAEIPTPTSAAALAQFFTDHKCNVIMGKSLVVALERAAALAWTLRSHTNTAECCKITPALETILKTLYGNKVWHSPNASLVYSIGSFYHASVGSLPPSDDDGSDADPPVAPKPPVVVLSSDPFGLHRPPAPVRRSPRGYHRSSHRLSQRHQPVPAPQQVTPAKASPESDPCTWPSAVREHMDLTNTYSTDEWKRA